MLYAVMTAELLKFKNKNGGYCKFELFDGERTTQAVLWDVEEGEDFSYAIGNVYKFEGTFKEYRGAKQLTVTGMSEVSLTEEVLAKFTKQSRQKLGWLIQELVRSIESVENVGIREFCRFVFSYKSVSELFERMPAGKSIHHNYFNGLLEHTVEAVKIAKNICEVMMAGDMDMVVAGALLHDIGKIHAYELKGVHYEVADVENTQGHIVTGIVTLNRLYDEYISRNKYSRDIIDIDHLIHIIVSHHGVSEWGSMKEPQTPEAMIVHLADLASARINYMIKE